MAKKKTAKKKPTFEQSLAQLEEIVAKLEGGQLGLADSLEQYENGVRHLRSCYQLLEDAERRIELVQDLDPSGLAKTEAFNENAESSGPATRSRRRSAKTASRDVDDGSSLF